jgi:predicted Zn-dependent protease
MNKTDLQARRTAWFFCIFLGLFFWTATEASALISIEDESKLGQQFVAAVRHESVVIDDDFANQYLNDLGRYLNQSVETQYFPLHLYFINNNTLNGFAGPGGHIFIFTGLLDTMDNADELAGVLCHEIAHVSSRHIAQRIEDSKKMSLVALAGALVGALIGGKPGTAVAVGSTGAVVQKILDNTREDEQNADQIGYQYMVNSGFDRNSILMVLKNLSHGNFGMTEQIPPYLLTHPTDSARISNIEIMIKGYHPKPKRSEVIAFEKTFPFVKAVLLAKYQKPEDAERWFNQDLEKGKNNAVAYFGLGILAKERAEYDKAISHFQKALESQPKSMPILRGLGEAYLLKGDYESALGVMTRALEIDNMDATTLQLLANTYQYMEKFQKAAEIYEKLISLGKANDDTYYQLGIAYGRQNKLGLAHYYFGIHFKRLGKIDQAKFHFQKASEFAKDDPDLKNRIEKAMKEQP